MIRILATYNQAISCALIGAGMAIAGKSLVTSLDPMILIFLRASIACIFLLPFIKVKKYQEISRRDLLMLLAGGVIGIYLANVLFYKGLTTSSAFNASLINALSPILTLMAMCVYIKQFPTKKDLISFFLALYGVILVITNGDFDIEALLYADGNLLLLLSVVASITYSIAATHKTSALSSSEFAFGSFFISAFFLAPSALQKGLLEIMPTVTLSQWLMILYLALAGSTIGFYLFTQSIAKIGPDITAYIVYSLAPLFVLCINLMLCNEPISIWQVFGSACILGSLFLHMQAVRRPQNSNERNV